MATSFDAVNDYFFKRALEDPDLFQFTNTPDSEVEELLKTKALDYMKEAIGIIKENSTPDVDFDDYDETLRQFGFDFTKTEFQIMADCMFQSFLSRDFAKLKIYNKYFSTNEIKLFSPSNERKTFVEMFGYLEKRNIRKIRSYNSRDRITGAIKTYSGVI